MADFKAATDRVAGCVTQEEMARELGIQAQSLRVARLDPANVNYRRPPAGWEAALATLARARARDLMELADELAGPEEARRTIEIDAAELSQIMKQHQGRFKTAMEEQLIEVIERAKKRRKATG